LPVRHSEPPLSWPERPCPGCKHFALTLRSRMLGPHGTARPVSAAWVPRRSLHRPACRTRAIGCDRGRAQPNSPAAGRPGMRPRCIPARRPARNRSHRSARHRF
jgi:hypothetical protein